MCIVITGTKKLDNKVIDMKGRIYQEVISLAKGTSLKIVKHFGKTQSHARGCDVLVTTPSKLSDLLKENRTLLSFCKFLVIYETASVARTGGVTLMEQIWTSLEGTLSKKTSSDNFQTVVIGAIFPHEVEETDQDYLYLTAAIVPGGAT